MTDPVPLASGREADVFGIDEQRVLRRYRNAGDVTAEAATMAYVAGLGFPAPKVYEAHGTDLVMERLDGPTMLQAMITGDVDVQAGATLLADLHSRLHELPPRLSSDPNARIVHLDLHPDNVMLSSRGPVVIDWRNAGDGPPDLDVALTALILAEVAVDDKQEMAAMAALGLTAFLKLADGDPFSMLDQAVAIRRANPTLAAEEIARLASAATLISDNR